MATAGRVVTDWVGDPGAVVEYGVRFTRPVVVPNDDRGATVEISGVVARQARRRHRARRPHRRLRRLDRAGQGPGRRPPRLSAGTAPRRPPASRRPRLHGVTTLADLTTLRLGGPAGRLVVAQDERTLVDAVRAADASRRPGAGRGRRQQPRRGRRGLPRHRRPGPHARGARRGRPLRRRLGHRRGRRAVGLLRRSAPSPRSGPGSRRCPASRARWARPRCRTSAPTARRWRDVVARVRTLGPRARRSSARSCTPTAASATARACSRPSPAAGWCST